MPNKLPNIHPGNATTHFSASFRAEYESAPVFDPGPQRHINQLRRRLACRPFADTQARIRQLVTLAGKAGEKTEKLAAQYQ